MDPNMDPDTDPDTDPELDPSSPSTPHTTSVTFNTKSTNKLTSSLSRGPGARVSRASSKRYVSYDGSAFAEHEEQDGNDAALANDNANANGNESSGNDHARDSGFGTAADGWEWAEADVTIQLGSGLGLGLGDALRVRDQTEIGGHVWERRDDDGEDEEDEKNEKEDKEEEEEEQQQQEQQQGKGKDEWVWVQTSMDDAFGLDHEHEHGYGGQQERAKKQEVQRDEWSWMDTKISDPVFSHQNDQKQQEHGWDWEEEEEEGGDDDEDEENDYEEDEEEDREEQTHEHGTGSSFAEANSRIFNVDQDEGIRPYIPPGNPAISIASSKSSKQRREHMAPSSNHDIESGAGTDANISNHQKNIQSISPFQSTSRDMPMETPNYPTRTKKQHILGILMVIGVALSWVASSILTQQLFGTFDYDKPFIVTYISSSLFSVYLIGMLWNRGWRDMVKKEWHRWMDGSDSLHGRAFETDADEDDHGSKVVVKTGGVSNVEEYKASEFASQPDMDNNASNLANTSPMTLRFMLHVALLFCPLWLIGNLLFNYGLRWTSVASSSIISTLSSFFTLLIASIQGVERFSLTKLFSVVLSTAGVVLVSIHDMKEESVVSGIASDPSTVADSATAVGIHDSWFLGDMFCLLAALFYAIYVTLLKVYMPDDNKVSMPLFFGLVGVLTFFGGLPLLVILHLTGLESISLPSTMKGTLCLFLNGILGAVVSDYLWARAILLTTPVVATLALSLSIPLSVVADMVISGLRFNAVYVFGLVLVVGGFVIVNVEEARFDHPGHENENENENENGNENEMEMSVVEDRDPFVVGGTSRVGRGIGDDDEIKDENVTGGGEDSATNQDRVRGPLLPKLALSMDTNEYYHSPHDPEVKKNVALAPSSIDATKAKAYHERVDDAW